MSTPLLQTYVYQGDVKRFFVSTIHRKSSAALDPAPWFYETLAWALELDEARGELVDDNSGATSVNGAAYQHSETCSRLLKRQHPQKGK